MAEVVVACEGVVRLYPTAGATVQALRGVDLAVTRRTVTAIVGPSGSGKSTLLGILAGLDAPTAGQVTLAGEPLTGSSRARRRLRRRHVAFLNQHPAHNLIPGQTLERQLTAAARHRGTDPRRIPGLLRRLGIHHRSRQTPERLSGGEQQRAGIARVLCADADLVICDEPTSELDTEATVEVIGLLSKVAADGAAVVIATHDPLVVDAANHVLLLRDGSVQSETHAGADLAVIDSIGRLHLPPELAAWYPARRARLQPDAPTRSIQILPP